MKRFILSITLLLATLGMAVGQTVVSSIDNLSNDKVYYIRCPRDYLGVNSSYKTNPVKFSNGSLYSTPGDDNKFAILKGNQGYYIYSTTRNKFVPTNGQPGGSSGDALTAMDTPDGSFQISAATVSNYFIIKNTEAGDWALIGGSQQFGISPTWKTEDDGDKWQFIEASTLEATVKASAMAKIQAYESTPTPSVTKQTIFVYDKSSAHNVIYRIPSIASISTGPYKNRVVAITDYRTGTGSQTDVGQAEVSIHAKYSDNFGQTWSDEIEVVRGQWGVGTDTRKYSYGDAVSIADRKSGKILMVSCSGNVSYPNATRSNHQGVETYFSEDGGATWTAPVDVSEQIYTQLDAIGIQSLFVGSGGFTQSKFIKKGDYYRIYGGILCRTSSGSGINYTIYTDDLGATWHLLGSSATPSITSGGDEAKVEELPDGSVLHSSRCTGGRIFNIWRWTDKTYTSGAWDGQATSNSSNSGIVATNNGTNGEILIVPAQRKSDNKCVYLAMQSIPFGSGRANVGIYWKELASKEDYRTTSQFAANWTKGYQASYNSSAYSAMVLQEDGNIGFMVEEETTSGCPYSQVYHNITYETITNNLYTFKSDNDPDFDKSCFLDVVTKQLLQALVNSVPTYSNLGEVGFYTVKSAMAVYDAKDEALAVLAQATPSQNDLDAAYNKLSLAIGRLEKIGLEVGKQYYIASQLYNNGTYFECFLTDVSGTVKQYDNKDANGKSLWTLENSSTTGYYYLKSAEGRYFDRAGVTTTAVLVRPDETGNTSGQYEGTYSIYCYYPGTSNSRYAGYRGDKGDRATGWWSTGHTEPTAISNGVYWGTYVRFYQDHKTVAELQAKINSASTSYPEGIGYYTTEAVANLTTVLTKAQTIANDPTSTGGMIDYAYNLIDETLATMTINLPKPGHFYRLQGKKSSKYASVSAEKISTTASQTFAPMVNTADASTIFFLEDCGDGTHGYMLNYKQGVYLIETRDVAQVGGTKQKFEFASSTLQTANAGIPYLTVRDIETTTPSGNANPNGRWLYDNGNATNGTTPTPKLDRNSTYVANNCEWKVTEVTQLPVTIGATGFATLNLPVPTIIPDDVEAWVASTEADNERISITRIKDGILPANCAVILYTTNPGEKFFDTNTTESGTATSAFDGTTAATLRTSDNIFVLGLVDDNVGLYSYTGSYIPGFKLYYVNAATTGNNIRLQWTEMTTTIQAAHDTSLHDGITYNINGHRVTKANGLVIINGKKVVIR